MFASATGKYCFFKNDFKVFFIIFLKMISQSIMFCVEKYEYSVKENYCPVNITYIATYCDFSDCSQVKGVFEKFLCVSSYFSNTNRRHSRPRCYALFSSYDWKIDKTNLDSGGSFRHYYTDWPV